MFIALTRKVTDDDRSFLYNQLGQLGRFTGFAILWSLFLTVLQCWHYALYCWSCNWTVILCWCSKFRNSRCWCCCHAQIQKYFQGVGVWRIICLLWGEGGGWWWYEAYFIHLSLWIQCFNFRGDPDPPPP